MTDKEKIIIDGVNVSQCEFYIYYSSDRYPHRCGIHKDMFGIPACCDVADCCKNCYFKQLKHKEQECEELKKQLMQKSEVDMFFNTPIEGWSNDPCGICPHKAENEKLKKEIINKNEKIKELRFSVSDLTNRLCYLNAEKSFRVVDLEQTLDEIAEIVSGKDEELDPLAKQQILDIINKAKGGKQK